MSVVVRGNVFIFLSEQSDRKSLVKNDSFFGLTIPIILNLKRFPTHLNCSISHYVKSKDFTKCLKYISTYFIAQLLNLTSFLTYSTVKGIRVSTNTILHPRNNLSTS